MIFYIHTKYIVIDINLISRKQGEGMLVDKCVYMIL